LKKINILLIILLSANLLILITTYGKKTIRVKNDDLITCFFYKIKDYKCFNEESLELYYQNYLKSLNLSTSLNSINYPNFYDYTTPEKVVNDQIILVNKRFYLEASFIPKSLEPVTNVDFIERDEATLLDKDALSAYKKMYKEAQNRNIELTIFSAYRSYEKQSLLYEAARNKAYVASPGHSEHQTGLSIDISTREIGLTDNFDKSDSFLFLKENAHKFGFILRYPKDKTDLTSYPYEPWHYRYVGKDAANIIKEQSLTLEEYIYNYTIINK